jgi:hypothetical protein
MKNNRNIMLEVAELIKRTPVGKLLTTSEIRTGEYYWGESGLQRLREHAKRFRDLHTGKTPYEYAGNGTYRIFGDFKRYCQGYVRDHKKN